MGSTQGGQFASSYRAVVLTKSGREVSWNRLIGRWRRRENGFVKVEKSKLEKFLTGCTSQGTSSNCSDGCYKFLGLDYDCRTAAQSLKSADFWWKSQQKHNSWLNLKKSVLPVYTAPYASELFKIFWIHILMSEQLLYRASRIKI